MFWPLCLERKVWNDPVFWLYNLHKSLQEGSQGKFPWNISFAKKKKKKSSSLLSIISLSGFLCFSIKWQWGNSGAHMPQNKSMDWPQLGSPPKPSNSTVNSRGHTSATKCPGLGWQHTQTSWLKQPGSRFAKMTCYKTTVYHRENAGLAKGKELTPTKHLEGLGPEPALQICYLMKSLNAPKTENYPHSTEEETEAQRASIICPRSHRWLMVKLELKLRCVWLQHLKEPQFLSHLSYI